MRRPTWQHGINVSKLPFFAGDDVDHPQRAQSESVLRVEIGVLRRKYDLSSVGRPTRLETASRQSPNGFTCPSHHENPAAVSARSEGYAFAIRGKRRLIVIVHRIGS
jgi:hypothetical protein